MRRRPFEQAAATGEKERVAREDGVARDVRDGAQRVTGDVQRAKLALAPSERLAVFSGTRAPGNAPWSLS